MNQMGPEGKILTTAMEELVANSYHHRMELELTGTVNLSTKYVPTDWAKVTPAEERWLWGGFKESSGVCPKCFMYRAANGSCECMDLVAADFLVHTPEGVIRATVRGTCDSDRRAILATMIAERFGPEKAETIWWEDAK